METKGENVPVAQTFATYANNPVYYKDIENQILLSNDANIPNQERAREYTLFARFEKIAMNKSAIQTYKHFLQRGCSFAKEIATINGFHIATAYRAIDTLVEMDLIQPIAPLKMRRTNGPKPVLYGLYNVTKQEETDAGNRYIRSKRKTYKQVQMVKQRCLSEIIDESIQFSKIVSIARKQGNLNFHFLDVADQAAYELQLEGVKVWR